MESYMIAAIGALSATVAALFWQLMVSKGETATAYKEILPAATLLMKTVESLQKFIDAHLRKEKESANGRET